MAEINRATPLAQVVRDLAAAQKSNRNAPAYSRWINRPVGRVFAAAAFKAGWTPNQVTGLSAVATFTGIFLIALSRPNHVIGLLAMLLLALGYALDSADGQLARLRGGGRPSGEWLDHVIDSAKMVSVHLAIGISWARVAADTQETLPLIPFAFAAVATVFFFAIVLTELLMKLSGQSPPSRGPSEHAPWFTSLLGIPVDYGLLIVLVGTLGFFAFFTWAYTVIFVLYAVVLALMLFRWYRRVDKIG